jgi:5-methylcytosine-specific restriction endonuclease McrA
VRTFAKKFYNSKAWHKTRQAYAASQHYLCEICKEPGAVVHHKQHLIPHTIANPDITLAWGNLQYLCAECHAKAHKAHSLVNNRATIHFKSDGTIAPHRPRNADPANTGAQP